MPCRILFLHHSFPGPFRHLAARFAARDDTTVLFLSEFRRKEVRLPGVRHITAPGARIVDLPEGLDPAEREFLGLLRHGSRMANALLRLKREGFVPDLIYASTGMGNSFYLKDIFPDAFYALNADWFYTKGANYNFFHRERARSPVDFAPARMRNLHQLNALAECDLAVTATEWQKVQFPPGLRDSLHVIHEGVDTNFFAPRPGTRFVTEGVDLSQVRELVTFSGRSAEPFRGFPQFYRSLPRLLAARPDCHALIMVDHARNRRKNDPESARDALAELLAEVPVDSGRVHILGFRPYAEYRRLLQASTVHVYLTAPFSLSSGLFEAMSCGGLVVGSDTAPVREVLRHGHNGFLCDFWDTDMLADTVTSLLARNEAMQPIRDAARQTILDGYNLAETITRHETLLVSRYAAWKQQEHVPA